MSTDKSVPTAGDVETAQRLWSKDRGWREIAAALAQARAEGFADWGPLFHRDLTRVLGIPESSSLDATMQAVRDLQVRYMEFIRFIRKLW